MKKSSSRWQSIRRQKEVGSLMPTGLTDSLTHAEFLDLARFVSELGKPGPFGQSFGSRCAALAVLDPPPADACDRLAASPSSDQFRHELVAGIQLW